MPTPSPHRHFRIAKALGLGGAIFLCQGFFCEQKNDPPGLPAVTLTDIHLRMEDPSLGSPGVYLAWTYPDGAQVSFFEIFQAARRDSLKHAAHTQPAGDSFHAVLALPDSSRPFTLYYAVRAIFVEPTGQKLYGDTLRVDSLTIAPSLTILQPGAGSHLVGRTLPMEVLTSSDNGVMIRMSYFEKNGGDWEIKQDTCLPTDRCRFPIFGHSAQLDSLILEPHPEVDSVQALFCVVGTESFQEQLTGLVQSLGCARFLRVHP